MNQGFPVDCPLAFLCKVVNLLVMICVNFDGLPFELRLVSCDTVGVCGCRLGDSVDLNLRCTFYETRRQILEQSENVAEFYQYENTVGYKLWISVNDCYAATST